MRFTHGHSALSDEEAGRRPPTDNLADLIDADTRSETQEAPSD